MKPEEAQKLKAGDAVYVRVIVTREGFTKEGNMRVGIPCGSGANDVKYRMSLPPERLHATLPSIGFRKGDIVRWFKGLAQPEIYEVKDTSPRIAVSHGDNNFYFSVNELALVCAAADRKDRKGGQA